MLALVLGGYVALRPQPGPKPADPRPWFYLVDDSKIVRLDVEYFDQAQVFVRDSTRTWHFTSVDGPPVGEDFQGTPFLAAGARSPRIISQDPKPDLTRYGLDDPKIRLRIHMEDAQRWRVFLGDPTPDRINNYAQIADDQDKRFPDIYLVDRTWGEFIATLITNPPLATPTAIPTTPAPPSQ